MLALVKSPPADAAVAVTLLSADPAMARKLGAALDPSQRFAIETLNGPLASSFSAMEKRSAPALLICDIREDQVDDWLALERFVTQLPRRPAIIVLSERVNDAAARRLLRLQITDWLPRTCSEAELRAGCEHALLPSNAKSAQQAHCIAFMSAVGGAGSTTLALAAASLLGAPGGLGSVCAIDLDFHFGALADHLDTPANLHLAELADAPERLDAHLLEVMLARHKSGLSLLASSAGSELQPRSEAAVVGRLLDLAATRFAHLVIDLPRSIEPWTESAMRGADRVYIVTELTVIGLRHARRLADSLAETNGIDARKSIIVNKYRRFGYGGLKRRHAEEILGERLAGFVSDGASVARDAQERGVLLSEIKRSNAIVRDLRPIVTTSAGKA